jgi:hypothetical protein
MGQVILVMAALGILGLVILSSNDTLLDNEQVVMDSEFGVASLSLATSLIEEIQGKLFDAAASDSGITSLSKLTGAGSLGPSPLEKYRSVDSTKPDFNDVDDFHNFSIEFVNDTTRPRVAQYRGESKGFRADYLVKSKVHYVTKNNPNGASSSTTWHKKVTITVSSPSSTDTLTIPTIISYWN